MYYIPFHTGMSLHFRMSGQSIPNRSATPPPRYGRRDLPRPPISSDFRRHAAGMMRRDDSHMSFCVVCVCPGLGRTEVKDRKGIKIYFDPVSKAARLVQASALVRRTFVDPEPLVGALDAVDSLVYHVAAHEIGHAIYSELVDTCAYSCVVRFLFLFSFLGRGIPLKPLFVSP